MELIELKEVIYKQIENINDSERLEDISVMLDEENTWDSLSNQDKIEMIDMAEYPEKYQWHSHHDVMNKIKVWLQK